MFCQEYSARGLNFSLKNDVRHGRTDCKPYRIYFPCNKMVFCGFVISCAKQKYIITKGFKKGKPIRRACPPMRIIYDLKRESRRALGTHPASVDMII
jgi:hypothetical protein